MQNIFAESAEAVGAIIKRFSSAGETTLYLNQLAGGGKIRSSTLPPALAQQLAGIDISAQSSTDDTSLCISFAEAGIAATGSLLLSLPDPGRRGVTALATKHAVFLHGKTIVPTLRDLSTTLKEQLSGGESSYLSITTGPSRTADIERVLTIGVHGPKELHILILEGE